MLTDFPSFQGSAEDLIIARKNSKIPILRKDFILDDSQTELLTESLSNALREFKEECNLKTEDLLHDDVVQCLEYAMKSL